MENWIFSRNNGVTLLFKNVKGGNVSVLKIQDYWDTSIIKPFKRQISQLVDL